MFSEHLEITTVKGLERLQRVFATSELVVTLATR